MNTLSYKTVSVSKEAAREQKEWVVIDATDQVVGRRYTGYPGGQRFNTPAELRKKPFGVERILRHAVKGMLPKGPLGRALLNNLYVYEGTEHKHEAQKPKAIDINLYK